MADAARLLSAEVIEQAKSGHPGMAMGIADVVTTLFAESLIVNPAVPDWPNRDRLVLSAGHGVMILYVAMYLLGFPNPTMDDLKRFRKLHSKTPGHPEFGEVHGIEATTGPLGQGMANAVGMAIAEKIMKNRFGSDLVDHSIFCIVGDGCMMEGVTHEAASLAGHLCLDNLIVIFDSNNIVIDGSTSLSTSEDTVGRFRSYGWRTISVNGHNFAEISAALKMARSAREPVMIECRTTIARGAILKEGSNKSHGSSLGISEVSQMREASELGGEVFDVPDHIISAWRNAGAHSGGSYSRWVKRYNTSPLKAEFDAALKCELGKLSFTELRNIFLSERNSEATRVSSGKVIESIIQHLPACIGGSADLTESNCVKGSNMKPIERGDFAGNYIHYGVREHAMAAIMNGMSLYGGIVPYAGTFFVFSDYMRPAIRLSAMMRRHVIYVLTHDSIGVGEDGPTHQPIEHLASLRAMPGIFVFRPADAVETVDSWSAAMSINDAPSILVLTRQSVPFIGEVAGGGVQMGAYIVFDSESEPDVVLMSTGSELSIAIESGKELVEEHGVSVRVISAPCWRIFEQQSAEYKNKVLCHGGAVAVAIEAGSRFGWDRYIGSDGIFIGMDDTFGLSAPASDLYSYFGITKQNVVTKVVSRLKSKAA